MVVDVVAAELDSLSVRIAGRFTRSEPRGRARDYVTGLVAGLERKNGWTLAERAGEVGPDGMQRLLRRADWDIDGVRDDLRSYATERLGDRDAVLIADDTGFGEEGNPFGRGSAPVFRHGRAYRELPDRGVFGLCLPARTCLGGPGAVSTRVLDRGP